jgi:hypothetical protein
MTRPFRGGVCEIEIARDARPGVEVDGKAIPGNLVPAPERGRTVRVAVRVPEGRHISDY